MKIPLCYVLVITALSLTFSACKKAEVIEYEKSWPMVNEEIFHLMKEWYLWNNTIPSDKDMTQYGTPQAALDALKYKTIDRWSYVETKDEYNDFFFQSAVLAYGFSLGQDAGGQTAVSYVSAESPASEAGLTRGCIVNRINGRKVRDISDLASVAPSAEGESILIQYTDTTGASRTCSITSRVIPVETVSLYKIINFNGYVYGYIVINSFVEVTTSKIREAFSYFKTNGVARVIIDLRYNGGGLLSGSQYLTELIAPASAARRTMYSLSYNSDMSSYNSSVSFSSTSPLNIDEIYFLVSGNTASASEMVINCIKPYKTPIIIGSTTHGKPVGMATYFYDEWAISPIMFSIDNANGEGDYYDGISPDYPVYDSYTRELGDTLETLLHSALHYHSLSKSASSTPMFRTKPVEFRGVRSCINMY